MKYLYLILFFFLFSYSVSADTVTVNENESVDVIQLTQMMHDLMTENLKSNTKVSKYDLDNLRYFIDIFSEKSKIQLSLKHEVNRFCDLNSEEYNKEKCILKSYDLNVLDEEIIAFADELKQTLIDLGRS